MQRVTFSTLLAEIQSAAKQMYASRPCLQKSNCSKAIYSNELWWRNGSRIEKVKIKARSCSIWGRILLLSIRNSLELLRWIIMLFRFFWNKHNRTIVPSWRVLMFCHSEKMHRFISNFSFKCCCMFLLLSWVVTICYTRILEWLMNGYSWRTTGLWSNCIFRQSFETYMY